ncbi:MAG TPA: MBL fold metallo-hydrolase [Anaerolineae bacterium]|nr:MBL fold metallo-hydrolase [Anaerolineae bacterium]HMR62645.1 MBL fold metallo-hydrolase [Anaerolineae bacterium]
MPRLNNLEYYIISDGLYWADAGGAFGLVPQVVWKQLLPPDELNRVPFALNSLLIRSEGKTILVDTGYGRKLDEQTRQHVGLVRPEGDLLDALARRGVQPEEIDVVINTHLHGDHCGGNTLLVDDQLLPAFPNAQYYVQRLEYADAITPNERTRATYFPDNYTPLYATGQLTLLNGHTTITNEVRTAVTRGHTRAHQIVILESGDESAIFVADLATLHYQFQRLAWVTSYDVEPLESIETKRFWQQWAVAHNALIIFQHDTQVTTGRLQPDKRNFKVVPVEVS